MRKWQNPELEREIYSVSSWIPGEGIKSFGVTMNRPTSRKICSIQRGGVREVGIIYKYGLIPESRSFYVYK